MSEADEPALVPFQSRTLSALPEAVRLDFRERLRKRVEECFANEALPPQTAPEEDHGETYDEEIAAQIGRACATCRGWCCQFGTKSLAYLTEQTLLRYRHLNPDAGIEDIVEDYISRIGLETFTDSCVYHGEHGCTLPSTMRSATCNQYICKGVTLLVARIREDAKGPTYVAATHLTQVCDIAPLTDS